MLGANQESAPAEDNVPEVTPDRSGADYPRRRTHVEKPDAPAGGYRATKRSSKRGKRLRRAATSERVTAEVSETAEPAGPARGTGLRYAVWLSAR